MPSPNYKTLLKAANISSAREVNNFFREEIIRLWVEDYQSNSVVHGDVTWQNFQQFTFVFDYTYNNEEYPASSLPDSRVVAAFGISNLSINPTNRRMMRRFWGTSTEAFAHFGDNYDKGHFIAHASGGPIDINLFPQSVI